MYIFTVKTNNGRRSLWLALGVIVCFAVLLFRVWPMWLRVGVWYVSYYLCVSLIAVAILRVIIWFILFHVGIDFWLFPNYFIDSNNPLDSFVPFLEVTKRDDMMDLRMLILRIGSVAAIVYGATEFMKEPKSLDDMTSVFSDLSNDVFEWGQNKFLGIPDNS